MVAPIYDNKKGIYRNLYREIDAENKRRETFQARGPKKGIYRELYRQLEYDKLNMSLKENKQIRERKICKSLLNIVNQSFSKLSYLLSSVTGKVKMLIVTCMFIKKPVSKYVENTLPIY